jgi:Trk K+ transport system NAD-binding subunit
VVGEASEESNLVKAGIERARVFMTVLGKDAANVFLILIAKRLNSDLFVVTRANQNETIKTLYAAGADGRTPFKFSFFFTIHGCPCHLFFCLSYFPASRSLYT